MKQFFLSTIILLAAFSMVNAQEYKKQLKNANKTLSKYYLDPVANKAELSTALASIDAIFAADDAKADPEAWITKGQIFNEIAKSIRDSDFKRKDVTQQAIHNELIKDKRFVLIGRGIYALNEWGYKQGIVSDVIEEVLKEANEPLHRDEIVKRVLAKRQVKETTILLNLQGKPQFVRTSKATYSLDESKKK